MLLKRLHPFFASTSVFVPNKNTKYADFEKGSIEKTLNYIALMRLILDYKVRIPTNSSLKEFKYKALLGGANFVSINLTPEENLKDYIIYDMKRNNTQEIEKLKTFCNENDLNIVSKMI